MQTIAVDQDVYGVWTYNSQSKHSHGFQTLLQVKNRNAKHKLTKCLSILIIGQFVSQKFNCAMTSEQWTCFSMYFVKQTLQVANQLSCPEYLVPKWPLLFLSFQIDAKKAKSEIRYWIKSFLKAEKRSLDLQIHWLGKIMDTNTLALKFYHRLFTSAINNYPTIKPNKKGFQYDTVVVLIMTEVFEFIPNPPIILLWPRKWSLQKWI